MTGPRHTPPRAHAPPSKARALKGRAGWAGENCLPGGPGRTPPARTAVLEALQVLAGSYEPGLMLAVYRDVQACLERAPSAGERDRLNTAVAVSNSARLAGDPRAPTRPLR